MKMKLCVAFMLVSMVAASTVPVKKSMTPVDLAINSKDEIKRFQTSAGNGFDINDLSNDIVIYVKLFFSQHL